MASTTMFLEGELKRCGTCHEWLPIEMFHRRSDRADGRVTQCKYCRAHTVRIEWCVRFEEPLPRPVTGLWEVYGDIIPALVAVRDDSWGIVWKFMRHCVKAGVLAEKEAAAIVARDVDGLDFTEIARLVEVDRATVSKYYKSGIASLRKFYGVQLEPVG